jgi:transposase
MHNGSELRERVAPLLPGKIGDPGRSGEDNRRFLEAVLWLARTGSPWRDLHREFGKWNSVFKRFRRWALKGVFEKIFASLSGDPDFEYAIIDGTIVRVHQQGTGARGGLKIGDRPPHPELVEGRAVA